MLDEKPIRKVSVVIPVYNEEESLPELVRRTDTACRALSLEYEILLVDDGSADRSAQMITDAADMPGSHVVGVLLNRNYGQHSAIMAGFSHVTGDLIITLDADLQNPPEEIPHLVQAAKQGYDVVGTVRQNRQDSWFRRRASRTINHLIQRVTGKAMGDYGCMLRAYRRHIVEAMLNCHERSTFIPILANTFARRTIELPVTHAEREFGDSKYSFMKLINLMYDLITCLTTTPLRLLSIVGSLIALAGFAFSLVLIVLRLFLGADWAGDGVFMLFAVLFIFVGAQFIGMGLLGEYIGRIYNDVRARPRYFIQRVIYPQQDGSVQEIKQ
ncbi:undecaprenyl-phosphate 4-deoxy-4-formamido-L-arabinose transferase [Pantoea wallisii]|uniref:Undecaprenyl-phosphate 4-deoxy-4-formamido-L-arabinose transferase n=1 Tax=Pantoea wallisii TaxID=1076551 RepID=A0A1X1DCB2_9GAMM|nr:undecaprenyl-phosphate 4-deoxy-4-formamido-L-arabinose transferase [Pantoea wallisii]ORM74141.1 undecaprenyl-phosphate 4-deoxy-4-formamido-L-arabinose transferase [Pantoea wallisii]